jgi:hypothetical protein
MKATAAWQIACVVALCAACSARASSFMLDYQFVAQFDHPSVMLRLNHLSANPLPPADPLPLRRVPHPSQRRLHRVPPVSPPWETNAAEFDWRNLVDLPPAHRQKHNECYAETASVTLTALWEMLYEESDQSSFDPDVLMRCAHEKPGVPALPEDILKLSETLSPLTGCRVKRGSPGMLLAPEPVVLCDLTGDWDIENRLVELLAMGPVSVGIESTNPVFRLYGGGVLSPEHVRTPKGIVDHAVSLVGFGTENGTSYWTIRNSWGEDWGEDGYARIERRRDNTGVLNSYAAVTRATKHKSAYIHKV